MENGLKKWSEFGSCVFLRKTDKTIPRKNPQQEPQCATSAICEIRCMQHPPQAALAVLERSGEGRGLEERGLVEEAGPGRGRSGVRGREVSSEGTAHADSWCSSPQDDPVVCDSGCARFRLLRRLLGYRLEEVRRIFGLLQSVADGTAGHGSLHLLSLLPGW